MVDPLPLDNVEIILSLCTFVDLVSLSHVSRHYREVCKTILTQRIFDQLERLFGTENDSKTVLDLIGRYRAVIGGTLPMAVLDPETMRNRDILAKFYTPRDALGPVVAGLQNLGFPCVFPQALSESESRAVSCYVVLCRDRNTIVDRSLV